MMIDEWRLMIE